MTENKCGKSLKCGHACHGVDGDKNCMPCLNGCDQKAKGQTSTDICVICGAEKLMNKPCIQLKCGHIFHFECVMTIIKCGWIGPRISFSFIKCPLCKDDLDHSLLQEILAPLKLIMDEVKKKALKRLQHEKLMNVPDLPTSLGSQEDDAVFAMDRYAYYQCSSCKKAYFGGNSHCQELLTVEYNPNELICGACSCADGKAIQGCAHGEELQEYKCRFCCSIAIFYCFGTTRFCNACHSNHSKLMRTSVSALPKCPVGPSGVQLEAGPCPLGLTPEKHPPTGEEYSLGCGMCREMQTF